MIKVRNQDLINALGIRVKSLRTSKQLTMQKFSELAGIDCRQLGYIEHGRTNVTVSTLLVISKTLDMTIHELMDFPPYNTM